MCFHVDGFLRGDGLESLCDVVEQLRDREGAKLQLAGTGFDAREIQKVIDHAGEPLDIVFDTLQIIGRLLVQRAGDTIQEIVHVSLDGSHRGPQLMGDH